MTAIAVSGVLVVASPRAALADAAKGAAVYKTHQCAMCHKVNGMGGKKGPDLSVVGAARDARWLEKYLVNPKAMIPKGTMPPAKVTPAELRDLIDYLATLKGGK
jgi:nitric oxide reductase subunit C